MPELLSNAQLTGRQDSHLTQLGDGHRLQAPVAEAFTRLQADALEAGFELAIASSFRSFERQCAIFNGKACGERPVHDDAGAPVTLSCLAPRDQLYAILRYSALPGTSRHHWGTDLDVFDAAAVAADYQVQLSPQEVSPGGPFDALHCWLDERMADHRSHGFYRPYARDRGGVAPERWHLSYAPLARDCAAALNESVVREAWEEALDAGGLQLREVIEDDLPALLARFVAVGEDWCPRS